MLVMITCDYMLKIPWYQSKLFLDENFKLSYLCKNVNKSNKEIQFELI